MEINFLKEWREGWQNRSAESLTYGSEVVGVHDYHTGPSWQYAKIRVIAEPAERFSVSFEIDQDLAMRLQEDHWLDESVYGILDVLATSQPSPVFGVRLRLVDAEHDPIDSSRIAFRMAGRDAAKHILENSRTRGRGEAAEPS